MPETQEKPKPQVLIEGSEHDNAPVPVSANGKQIVIQRDVWTEVDDEHVYVLADSEITFRLKDEPEPKEVDDSADSEGGGDSNPSDDSGLSKVDNPPSEPPAEPILPPDEVDKIVAGIHGDTPKED